LKTKIKIVFLLLLLLTGQIGWAQQVKAVAKIDTNSIMIGDQVKLKLSFTLPANCKALWTPLSDSLCSKIEIVNKSKIDTVYSENKLEKTLTQSLTITSFDSGFYNLPPFRFAYHKPNDTSLVYAESNPLMLNVLTVSVDTTKTFKDIKAPLSVPFTFRELLPWIGGSLAVILIVLFLIYYFNKRKKAEPILRFPHKPTQPFHVIALEALEKLRTAKLWQTGHVKQYHTELTDILRKYLEDRFSVSAIEMTTDEILDSLNEFHLPAHLIEKLTSILNLADLVKFAKEQPLPLHHDQSLNFTVDFIKGTIPEDHSDRPEDNRGNNDNNQLQKNQ